MRIMILPSLVLFFLTTLFQVPLQFYCLWQEIQLQEKKKKCKGELVEFRVTSWFWFFWDFSILSAESPRSWEPVSPQHPSWIPSWSWEMTLRAGLLTMVTVGEKFVYLGRTSLVVVLFLSLIVCLLVCLLQCSKAEWVSLEWWDWWGQLADWGRFSSIWIL